MTAVDGFTGKYIKWYIIYTRINNNMQTKITYNMSVAYFLFYRTYVNIENPPAAAWICLSCIKSIKKKDDYTCFTCNY